MLHLISQRTPLTEFLQRTVSPVLLSDKILQTFVRLTPPAIKLFRDNIPILCTFLFKNVAFFLNLGQSMTVSLLLSVLKRPPRILQFASCDVILLLYRLMGFQQSVQQCACVFLFLSDGCLPVCKGEHSVYAFSLERLPCL